MVRLTMIGAAALLLCGFAEPSATVIDSWNGGPKTPAYHHVKVDCQAIRHAHGRNAINGWWSAALADVDITPSGPGLTMACRDGTACITSGVLQRRTGSAASHVMPFDSPEDAEGMASQISALRKACAA